MKLENLDWNFIYGVIFLVIPMLMGAFWLEYHCYYLKMRELDALETQLKIES
ncbi:MAG: hypothetical protein VKK32_03345 [Candidatus Melainabacteria bacterium]|jgi:hypothetical protein|nr:hypothetical protein [Candidatus Melainabacteria bacterium]